MVDRERLLARLTGPGGDFALVEREVRGIPMRVYATGPQTLREVLLSTGAALDDVVEPERGQVVPTSYRGDGVWLWPDAVAYYLEEHGLAPDEHFLEHIRAVGGPPARLDAVSTHRAVRHLLES